MSSKQTEFYEITWNPTIFPGGRVPYDGRVNPYHCTCPNYKYKAMHKSEAQCKHIKKLKGTFCDWLEFIEGGQTEEQKLNYICPKCNGKTQTIRMGI